MRGCVRRIYILMGMSRCDPRAAECSLRVDLRVDLRVTENWTKSIDL